MIKCHLLIKYQTINKNLQACRNKKTKKKKFMIVILLRERSNLKWKKWL
jgi:hypothetical protein